MANDSVQSFDILGQVIVGQVIGDTDGLDASAIFSTAATLANSALASSAAKKEAAKTTKTDADQFVAVATADNKSTQANAEAMYAEAISAKDKNPAYAIKAAAARGSANQAAAAQDTAAAGLSPAVIQKRIGAAKAAWSRYSDEAMKASSAAAASPRDGVLIDKALHANMYAQAAQATVNKVGQAAPGSGTPWSGAGGSVSSFLTKMHGGVPMYAWGMGGAVALTGAVLLIRSMRK